MTHEDQVEQANRDRKVAVLCALWLPFILSFTVLTWVAIAYGVIR